MKSQSWASLIRFHALISRLSKKYVLILSAHLRVCVRSLSLFLPPCYFFVHPHPTLHCPVNGLSRVQINDQFAMQFSRFSFLVFSVFTPSHPICFVAPDVMFCISCFVFPAFPLPFASNMLVTGRPRPSGRGAKRGRPRGSRRGFISTRGRGITVNLTNSDLGLGKSMSCD